MRPSHVIQARVLDFIEHHVLGGPGPQLIGIARERTRKVRRGLIRRTLVDLALARAIQAGIIPPAEDAPEKDWEEFFTQLLQFLEGLAELFLRIIDAFPE